MIFADDVASQPWRNGGGQSRELLAWPSSEQCDLRVALADIDKDGPFSTYDGVERWIVVISGVGIELGFSDRARRLLLGDEPLQFDGGDAPGCRLVDGPTRDLNMMVHGGRGVMRSVDAGVVWNEEFAVRGVFTAAAGTWSCHGETRRMPAMALLWLDGDAAGNWKFEYEEATSLPHAWWLGFTPSGD
ncbi:HutD family protein [soil metagenome]